MLVILCFVLLFLPFTSEAKEPLEAGVAVREEYNDNVFLTSHNEKSDTATTVEPSLKLLWTHKEHSLKLAYNSSLLYYNENSSQNRFLHRGEAEANFSLAKNSLKFLVQDTYDFFQRDIRESEATRNRAEGNDLILNPSFNFGLFEPVYFQAGYLYQRRDYRHPEDGVEWRSQGLNLTLGVNTVSKTDVSLTYGHQDKDFSHKSPSSAGIENFEDQQAGLSIKSEASDKLTGEISCSHLWRKSKSGKKHEGNVITTDLIFKPADKLSIEPRYVQNFYERVDGKSVERKEWEVMVVHQLGQWGNLRYGVFGYEESFLNSSRRDKSLGGRTSLSVTVLTRIIVTLGGSYERLEYKGDDLSKADRSTVNAMITYNVKDWANFFISYNRLVNIAATGNVNEYENNRFAVGVKIYLR